MKPSKTVQPGWRVNLTLLSAFFSFNFCMSAAFADGGNQIFLAQQNPVTAPSYTSQPMQWQGQPGQPQSQWNTSNPNLNQSASPNNQWSQAPQGTNGNFSTPGQFQSNPAMQGNQGSQNGFPPQGYSPQAPGSAPYGQQQSYGNGMATQNFAPQNNYAPPQNYAPQQGYAPPPNSSSTGNYAPPPASGYSSQPQNWNYPAQQQGQLQGQAQQYANGSAQYGNSPPQQNQVPTPPANEGYPSVNELNEAFNQNPNAAAANSEVQQHEPSTASKVGAGLLNMVKNSMMTPSMGGMGMGMPGMGMGGMGMGGMGMGGVGMGGYGMPYGGGYGMPYGAAPMGYPMMGSPGLLGAPMGMGSGGVMNNIMNQGLRMFHF